MPCPNSAHRQQQSSHLAPSGSVAATPTSRADPRIGFQAVTVLVRAFACRAVVAVLATALRLAFAPGRIRAHARIVLHETGIFACLRDTGSAVAGAFGRVFVRVQLEWILVE